MAKLLAIDTHCEVRHYSREAKLYKEYLRQRTTWLGWKQYAEERLDDWQREISSDRIRGCFDVPELKYSRERVINGTGYVWLPSDGNVHASCLGISPALLYGEPTLSSLADSGLIRSPSIIPLEAKLELDRMHRFIKLQAKGGHK